MFLLLLLLLPRRKKTSFLLKEEEEDLKRTHISFPFDAWSGRSSIDVTIEVDVITSFDAFGVQWSSHSQAHVGWICNRITHTHEHIKSHDHSTAENCTELHAAAVVLSIKGVAHCIELNCITAALPLALTLCALFALLYSQREINGSGNSSPSLFWRIAKCAAASVLR